MLLRFLWSFLSLRLRLHIVLLGWWSINFHLDALCWLMSLICLILHHLFSNFWLNMVEWFLAYCLVLILVLQVPNSHVLAIELLSHLLSTGGAWLASRRRVLDHDAWSSHSWSDFRAIKVVYGPCRWWVSLLSLLLLTILWTLSSLIRCDFFPSNLVFISNIDNRRTFFGIYRFLMLLLLSVEGVWCHHSVSLSFRLVNSSF